MGDRRSVASVYIGWDAREARAYEVAAQSLEERSSIPVQITPLRLRPLELQGLIRRPRSIGRGAQMWDHISNAPMSTEFAISRFLTPLLAQAGWVLFCDCDVLFLEDIAGLFELADDEYAVMCVKHPPLEPGPGFKMDGQMQTSYARKNWSSVMLFNCDHPANRGLTLEKINTLPGRDLHRFCWLDERWIGELPPEWNWLVGVQPCPISPKLAHFTLGGPWLAGWIPHEHDSLWLAASAHRRA
jgi:lipopolysaccharide biosynthesis glycosyltransferase